MATRNVPKIKTVNSWKEKWLWLVFNDDATMKCCICGKFEERLSSMPGYSNSFIKGSRNYKALALSDHESCKTHMQAVKFNLHKEATKKGEVYRPPPVKVTLPTNAPIAQALKKKRDTEMKGLVKLFDVAYFIAKKGRPFTDFKDNIELEKLHGVSFHGTGYEHNNACRDFVKIIGDYLFEKYVKSKVERANFITILNDGTTDSAIQEQEVIYLLFADPDTFQPRLAFFTVAELNESKCTWSETCDRNCI